MNAAPLTRPIRLADARVSPPVFIAATIIRDFPPARLADVETAWSPARQRLATVVQVAGLDLESSHWDWGRKAERVVRGELSLIAIECEGDVQGLIAIPLQPRPATLTPSERLVYVDYLEAVPWNQRAPSWPLRFRGVGPALITEAIIVSIELGLGGRVGLHSLPQAESFYAAKCGMRRLGADQAYYNLVYFEYTEGDAKAWLAVRNTE